ncbi:DsbA family protein [Patescibacteria group bacterium]|nr:DsbA family protein [Patescibacteria group bacterium]
MKKTYLLGLIAIAVLAGIFWYANWSKNGASNQTASITGQGTETGASVNIQASEADGDIILGNPDAPVTIIEYSSHLCGHCVNFHLNTLPVLIDKYVQTGQLKIISRLVSPVELSSAVLCANEQNAFYKFDEYLFSHVQEVASVDDIKAIAGKLGLDQKIFDTCYNADKYGDQIKSWFDKAEAEGVTGTPTFFINGEEVIGNQPLDVFESIIEKYLK